MDSSIRQSGVAPDQPLTGDGYLAVLKLLEHKLAYDFRDGERLSQALTHPSFANEQVDSTLPDNQRLEFLGDAVLGLAIAELLYERYQELPEGRLSRLKSALVCEVTLADLSRQLGVDQLLRLGRGERVSGGNQKPSILADAMEAILGAVFLDGGYQVVKGVIERLFLELFDKAQLGWLLADYKTSLQEWAQAQGKAPPKYSVVEQTGPAHKQCFTVEVTVDGMVVGVGLGNSKKVAQKQAAKQALVKIEEGGDDELFGANKS